MHYLGFAIVDAPTDEAVKDVMADSEERHWDWYRCGGRWDGYLLGDAEMKARETHNGFNFDASNNAAARNAVKVSEYTGETPYFFVLPSGEFVPRKYWNEFEKREDSKWYGAIIDTPHFDERWKAALAEHADKFFVVIDAHN